MTVAKTIFSGVAVIILAGMIMGSVDVYSSVQANTKHRLESKEDGRSIGRSGRFKKPAA